jgi:hypothetical protein
MKVWTAPILRRLGLSLRMALVLGCVRLYLEPDERRRRVAPSSFVPIVDCNPEQAVELRRRLERQGYSVVAIPL